MSRGLNEEESSVPSSEEHSGQRTNKYTGPKMGTRYSCGPRLAGTTETAGTAVRCSQVGKEEAGARCGRDGHSGLVGREGRLCRIRSESEEAFGGFQAGD